jgi:hypothetical protein
MSTRALLGHQRFQSLERLGLAKFSLQVLHALGEPRPRLLIEFRAGSSALGKSEEHLGQTLQPGLGGAVSVIDSDDRKFLRQHTGARQIVERGHD